MPKPDENNQNNLPDENNDDGKQQPTPPEGDDGQKTPPDKHGEPTINRGRYDREMKEKQAEIDKLTAELEKLRGDAKGASDAMAEVAKLREELKDKDLTHELDKAGCVNLKAAKAVLDDYEGDVSKLIEGAPYLFQPKQQGGTTGSRSKGAPQASDELVRMAREAAGTSYLYK